MLYRYNTIIRASVLIASMVILLYIRVYVCCECACVYAIIYYFFAPAKTSSVCERCECARAPAGRDKICHRIRSLRRSRPVAKRTRYVAPDVSFYAFPASPTERRRNRVILYCVDNIHCCNDVKSRVLFTE